MLLASMEIGKLIILCFLLVLAYGLGSISGAIISCRLFSLPDPRKSGSKNPGSTNVYRLGGTPPAILTLAIDGIKGAIPVYLAIYFEFSALLQGLVALTSIAGHLYPLYFQFKGGKGVATTLGAGIILSPLTTLFLTICWIAIARRVRISSIASLTAAAVAPFAAYYIDPEYTLVYSALSVVIIFRHKDNIIGLFTGNEKHLDKPDL